MIVANIHARCPPIIEQVQWITGQRNGVPSINDDWKKTSFCNGKNKNQYKFKAKKNNTLLVIMKSTSVKKSCGSLGFSTSEQTFFTFK